MICYNCRKKFIVRRNFLSLFETKKYYICSSCRKTYPIKLSFQTIPLENYTLYAVSIFQAVFQLNLESYAIELSKIVAYFMKSKPDLFLVFLDSFKINDYTIEMISFLADCEKKSVLLICCELKK